MHSFPEKTFYPHKYQTAENQERTLLTLHFITIRIRLNIPWNL